MRVPCSMTNMHPCRVCGKLLTKSEFILHRHKCIKEKQCSCDLCGKSFVSLSALHAHLQLHSGKNHIREKCTGEKYSGEKPYMCQLYERSFTKSSSLTLQKCVHTEEKPYSCQVCGKLCARLSFLSQHMSVHRKKEPFLCQECGKAFAFLSDFV